MKKTCCLLVLSIISILLTNGTVLGQVIDKDFQIKKMSRTVIQDLETVRSNPNIEASTQSLQIAKTFFSKNIYPTTDAFLLIYNLNPGFWPFGPPAEHALILPDFPQLSDSQQLNLKKAYDLMRKPNVVLNQRFKTQSIELLNALNNLPRGSINPRGLYDSLRTLYKEIIPYINKSSEHICQAQMESYLADLKYITGVLDSMSINRNTDLQDLAAISEMVDGFFVTTSWKKNRGDIGFLASPTWNIYYTAAFALSDETKRMGVKDDESKAEVDLSKPANAAIYVYRINPDGSQNPSPDMDAFDVYYGSNGFKYSLKRPKCDTLSYFSFHPVNRASTLPVVLGSGSYCIVLKDRKTGRLYVRSDISLSNEKIYDKNNLIILPFTIDK